MRDKSPWKKFSLSNPQIKVYKENFEPQKTIEMGYCLTQCKKNGQGYGNLGLNTPCNIISSDVDPSGEDRGLCESLFVQLLTYYSHLDNIAL